MAKKQDKQPQKAATEAGKPWNISPEVTKETVESWVKWLMSYADKEETVFIYHCISAYLTRPGRNARFTEDMSKMENKAEVLWINRINECLALADADDLSIFYTFIRTYQEEKKKKKQQ